MSVVRADFTLDVVTIDPSKEDLNVVESYGYINWQNPTYKSFTGHTGKINKVVYAPGRQLIATCSEDKSIRLWNIKTSASLQFLGSERPVKDILFDTEEKYLVTGGQDGIIRIWDLELHQSLVADETKTEFYINDQNWDGLIADGNGLTAWILRERWGFVDNDLEISPDGRYLFQHAYNGVVNIYDGLNRIRTIRTDQYAGTFEVTRDYRYVIHQKSSGLKGKVNNYIFAPVFSKDSFLVKTTSSLSKFSFSGPGQWIEMVKEKPVVHKFDDVRTNAAVAEGMITEKGDFFLQTMGDSLITWDLKRGSKKIIVCKGDISLKGFSPANSFVVLKGYAFYQLVRMDNYTSVIINLPNMTDVHSFSKDEKQIAIAGRFGDFYVYDITTGKSEIYSKHGRGIYSLSFSPDGKWIASGSRDRTTRFWNVKTKDFTEYKFLNPVEKVLYSPDGNYLFVNSGIATHRLIAPSADSLFQRPAQ